MIDASVLDITNEQIADGFSVGLRQVSAFCFTLNYPTIVNVPHSLLRAYKEALALGLEMNTYTWEGLDVVKTILENPDAFIAASGGGGGAGGAGGDAAPAKEPTPEPSESSAAPMNPFGADDSSDDSDSDSS